jgi:predicted NBD/HSP70 family sugar kinase
MNFTGDIVGQFNEEWDSPPPDEALPLMTTRVQTLLAQTAISQQRLLGIGVAMPGPFLTQKKRIVSPVKFPQWQDFPALEAFTEAFGFPVIVENDAMAAAVGELFHGEGRNHRDFYYVHFGDGLGGAMIIDGHPFQGFSPNTGELGWMRHSIKGRRAVIGNYLGLQPLYSFLRGYGLEVMHFQELESLFEEQNAYLWEWLNEAVDCLDSMLDAINVIFGPEAIFLGGHFPNPILDYLIERLNIEATATRASQPDRSVVYQPKVLRATSGDLSSALGAATLPLYETFSTRPDSTRSNLNDNGSS